MSSSLFPPLRKLRKNIKMMWGPCQALKSYSIYAQFYPQAKEWLNHAVSENFSGYFGYFPRENKFFKFF